MKIERTCTGTPFQSSCKSISTRGNCNDCRQRPLFKGFGGKSRHAHLRLRMLPRTTDTAKHPHKVSAKWFLLYCSAGSDTKSNFTFCAKMEKHCIESFDRQASKL